MASFGSQLDQIEIGIIRFGDCARVAELVDALDLGSSRLVLWGFDSPLSHHRLSFHELVYRTPLAGQVVQCGGGL